MQHAPNYSASTTGTYGQLANAPGLPQTQVSPHPPPGDYSQYSTPPPQASQGQPPATYGQSTGVTGVTGDYSQQQNPYSQQNFPPPPPGPPPQSSSGPTPGSTGYQPPHSPDSHQIYAAYSQGPTELSSQAAASPPYQHHSYPQAGSEQARGFDDYGYEQNRGYGDYDGAENQRGFEGERGMRGRINQYKDEGRRFGQELSSIGNKVSNEFGGRFGKYMGGSDQPGRPYNAPRGPMTCQVLRSCTTWSNGTPLEHSIQNAYIEVIRNSQHFVYIENQFFITATGDKQSPVKNLIGQALVERILRAARNGEKYKVIVVIPAVPAFAGDLRDDASLGTRAIMEFQYHSINRGGQSIMEKIAEAGFNPMNYIRFYNLRNYDRINCNNAMRKAEQASGVSYEEARKQHGDIVGAGYGSSGYGTGANQASQAPQYQRYQTAAQGIQSPDGRWDTVSECYMLGGQDIRTVPWDGPPGDELDAFVSEELYIHSKVSRSLFQLSFLTGHSVSLQTTAS